MKIDQKTRVLILTGAGVSAESGLATFRDSNGLWEGHEVDDVATPAGFARDPDLVWRFYSERRQAAARALPNAAHLALARLEADLGERFLMVTQNVDGLHYRAGSRRFIELHGNLFMTRCSECNMPREEDDHVYFEGAPRCGGCNALLRPDIVWFGEDIDDFNIRPIIRFVAGAGGDLRFVAIGTSGLVYPAASLVSIVKSIGGSTLLVNKDRANADMFDEYIPGLAGEILPTLFRR